MLWSGETTIRLAKPVPPSRFLFTSIIRTNNWKIKLLQTCTCSSVYIHESNLRWQTKYKTHISDDRQIFFAKRLINPSRRSEPIEIYRLFPRGHSSQWDIFRSLRERKKTDFGGFPGRRLLDFSSRGLLAIAHSFTRAKSYTDACYAGYKQS